MEILVLLLMVFFCIVGLAVSRGLKAASREACAVGDYLVAESERMQAEIDEMKKRLQTVRSVLICMALF
jgi:hypothetical protein